MLQWPLAFGAVEVALRGGDESIGPDLSDLEATDENFMPAAARPGVCADQRPVIFTTVPLREYVIHDHPHIRERGHERLSGWVIALRPTAGAPSLTVSESPDPVSGRKAG